MADSAIVISQKLISHLANIDKTRKKSEELLNEGKLVNRDIDLIYSGLFIEAVTSFERFIEDLFIKLLSEKVIHPSKKVKLITTFKTTIIARHILHGGRQYLDWLPYERYTKKRAKAFFINGIPFTGLDKGINTDITPSIDKKIERITERISIIRNVLAHKSLQSFHRFQSEIIVSSGALRSKEKKPIGYLRGLHSIHPTPTTRYEQIINEIKYISILLTSKKLK